MIWFAVFFSLTFLSMAFTRWLVPAEYIRRYGESGKDATYRIALALWHSVWIVAAVQQYCAPNDAPLRARLFGLFLVGAGHSLVISARRVNDLFIPTVQYVPPSWRVKNGPYRLMKHPGYNGFILSAIGAACLLGQPWAFVPMFAYVLLIIWRIHTENRILSGKQFQ